LGKTINASDDNIAARVAEIDAMVAKFDTGLSPLRYYVDNDSPVGTYHSVLPGNDVYTFTSASGLQNSVKTLASNLHSKLHELRQDLVTAKQNILLAQAGLDNADNEATGSANF
jgi:hypothetical protein